MYLPTHKVNQGKNIYDDIFTTERSKSIQDNRNPNPWENFSHMQNPKDFKPKNNLLVPEVPKNKNFDFWNKGNPSNDQSPEKKKGWFETSSKNTIPSSNSIIPGLGQKNQKGKVDWSSNHNSEEFHQNSRDSYNPFKVNNKNYEPYSDMISKTDLSKAENNIYKSDLDVESFQRGKHPFWDIDMDKSEKTDLKLPSNSNFDENDHFKFEENESPSKYSIPKSTNNTDQVLQFDQQSNKAGNFWETFNKKVGFLEKEKTIENWNENKKIDSWRKYEESNLNPKKSIGNKGGIILETFLMPEIKTNQNQNEIFPQSNNFEILNQKLNATEKINQLNTSKSSISKGKAYGIGNPNLIKEKIPPKKSQINQFDDGSFEGQFISTKEKPQKSNDIFFGEIFFKKTGGEAESEMIIRKFLGNEKNDPQNFFEKSACFFNSINGTLKIGKVETLSLKDLTICVQYPIPHFSIQDAYVLGDMEGQTFVIASDNEMSSENIQNQIEFYNIEIVTDNTFQLKSQPKTNIIIDQVVEEKSESIPENIKDYIAQISDRQLKNSSRENDNLQNQIIDNENQELKEPEIIQHEDNLEDYDDPEIDPIVAQILRANKNKIEAIESQRQEKENSILEQNYEHNKYYPPIKTNRSKNSIDSNNLKSPELNLRIIPISQRQSPSENNQFEENFNNHGSNYLTPQLCEFSQRENSQHEKTIISNFEQNQESKRSQNQFIAINPENQFVSLNSMAKAESRLNSATNSNRIDIPNETNSIPRNSVQNSFRNPEQSQFDPNPLSSKRQPIISKYGTPVVSERNENILMPVMNQVDIEYNHHEMVNEEEKPAIQINEPEEIENIQEEGLIQVPIENNLPHSDSNRLSKRSLLQSATIDNEETKIDKILSRSETIRNSNFILENVIEETESAKNLNVDQNEIPVQIPNPEEQINKPNPMIESLHGNDLLQHAPVDTLQLMNNEIIQESARLSEHLSQMILISKREIIESEIKLSKRSNEPSKDITLEPHSDIQAEEDVEEKKRRELIELQKRKIDDMNLLQRIKAITILRQGNFFLKYGRSRFTSASKRQIIFSWDLKTFNWSGRKKIKTFNTGNITEIKDGRITSNFKKFKTKNKELIKSSFSLCMKARSIDLEAPSQNSKNEFISSLQLVLDLMKENEKELHEILSKSQEQLLDILKRIKTSHM